MFVYFKISSITIGKIFRILAPNLNLPRPIDKSGFPEGAQVRNVIYMIYLHVIRLMADFASVVGFCFRW